MYLFYFEGFAQTASFRVPETHTFHQTLPLPPKTTLIGMLGAALGYGLEEVHAFVEKNNIRLGVIGDHQGLMRDLWNYRKITTKEKKYTTDDIKQRRHFSVLIREYLIECCLLIAVGGEDKEAVERCHAAITSPCYPLTAGNSDDLFKIFPISKIEEQQPILWKEFEDTVIPGNMYKAYETPSFEDLIKKTPITEPIFAPQVFRLPTKFTFEGEERRVAAREEFTFIGSKVTLNTPQEAYIIQDKGVVLH